MRDKHEVIINQSGCTKCGLCVKDCPMNILEMTLDGARPIQDTCLFCGHCQAICPVNVVEVTGFEDKPLDVKDTKFINPDDFLSHMKARRSVRFFKDTKVSKEMVEKIIEAGQYSPTGSNSQNVTYTVLQDDLKTSEHLAIEFLNPFFTKVGTFEKAYANLKLEEDFLFKKAPLVIVIKSTNQVDGTIAAASMEIMANALGLGVFYSGMFARAVQSVDALKQILGVEEKQEVVTALVIGHPDVKYQRTAPKEKPSVLYK